MAGIDPLAAATGMPSFTGGDAGPSDAFSSTGSADGASQTFGDVVTGTKGLSGWAVVVLVAVALVGFAWLNNRKT